VPTKRGGKTYKKTSTHPWEGADRGGRKGQSTACKALIRKREGTDAVARKKTEKYQVGRKKKTFGPPGRIPGKKAQVQA